MDARTPIFSATASAHEPAVPASARGLSPLRYPGGKGTLAPAIIGLLARGCGAPELVVEPFAGGAAFTLACLRSGYGGSFGIADKDPLVHAFWSVVFSERADALCERIETSLLTLAEWDRIRASAPQDPVGLAFKCIYMNRTSFNGILRPSAGAMGGRSQIPPSTVGDRFNRPDLARRIRALSRQSHRVAFVENLDWQDTVALVRRRSPRSVAWYLDPPYFRKAELLYNHVFADADHLLLRDGLSDLPGTWALSYDACPEAFVLYGDHPGLAEIDVLYNAKGRRSTGARLKEIIVTNVSARRAPISETTP